MSLALIITANATGLAVAKSLKKNGVDCIGFSKSNDICLHSRLFKKKI